MNDFYADSERISQLRLINSQRDGWWWKHSSGSSSYSMTEGNKCHNEIKEMKIITIIRRDVYVMLCYAMRILGDVGGIVVVIVIVKKMNVIVWKWDSKTTTTATTMKTTAVTNKIFGTHHQLLQLIHLNDAS